MNTRLRLLVSFSVLFCLVGSAFGANANATNQVHIVVAQKGLNLLPPGDAGMLNLLRHPNGSIWLHTGKEDLGHTLFRSKDNGESWKPVLISLPEAQPNQYIAGLGITRDGKLWLVHQQLPDNGGTSFVGKKLHVSCSEDDGRTWKTATVDFGPLAPTGKEDPFEMACAAWAYCSFIESPDGTLMFSTSLRYPDWKDYQQKDQTRPGIRDVMVRSKDGGKTWGDATLVHQHATETDHAVDPIDPDRILAASRKQSFMLPGDNPKEVERITGQSEGWVWKGGLLLESTDGGRVFKEVPGSYVGYYAHRANLLWTNDNVVIFEHNLGQRNKSRMGRISFDGGKTWIADDGKKSTPLLAKSKKFEMFGNTGSATIDVGPNQFMTVYLGKRGPKGWPIKRAFWRLKRGPKES